MVVNYDATIGTSLGVGGNVTASYFIGNGSLLSGIDATSIQNGTSNVKVYANANVGVTAAGTTWTFTPSGTIFAPSNAVIVAALDSFANIPKLTTGNLQLTSYGVKLGYQCR